jgi:O-antigen/teichoic acid export membrane protein
LTTERKVESIDLPKAKRLQQEDHLRTDHLTKNLRKRTVSAGIITGAAQAVKFAVNLLQSIILARLLLPEDFGLIAMVTTVTGLLRVFKDAGLSTATIQKGDISQAQVSNLFWINVGVSGALSLLVATLAPAVAWFYREPRLVSITLALASTFAISGAVVQHQALLNRQMRFKAIALVDIVSATVGLLAGIIMAWAGLKYWSLVGLQLFTSLTELGMTLWISRWRPSRPQRRAGTKSLVRFGASLTMASIFRRIAAGMDSLLIGRWYGADAVGLYTRGAILLMRPIDQLIVPLESVFIPVLSRLQNEPERYRRTFLQAYAAVALISFPVSGLFMALSRPIVLVLLGHKWEQVVPIFAWFSIAGLYIPLYYAAMWLLNTQGRGRDIMITGIIFSTTTVGSFVAGLPFGPVGVAASFSCVGLLLRVPIQYYIVGRSGPVSTSDLWNVTLRYLPNCVIVGGVTWFAQTLPLSGKSSLVQLLIGIPAGLTIAVIMTLALPSQRRDALRVWDLIKPYALRLRRKS